MRLLKHKTTAALMAGIMVCSVLFSADLLTVSAETAGSAEAAGSDEFTAPDNTETKEPVKDPPYTGFRKNGSKTYYYVKDKLVRSTWKKANNGKIYYFDGKGVMQKNTIAGTKKKGRYYVGRDGVRVNTKEMNLAVKFVLKHSKASASRGKRLKQCFTYACKHCAYRVSMTR